jgi:hypothetical protein
MSPLFSVDVQAIVPVGELISVRRNNIQINIEEWKFHGNMLALSSSSSSVSSNMYLEEGGSTFFRQNLPIKLHDVTAKKTIISVLIIKLGLGLNFKFSNLLILTN